MDIHTLHRVLDLAGVYPDSREAIEDALGKLPRQDPVQRIIIHLDRKSPPMHFDVYGPRVVPVYNYFQAAHDAYNTGDRVRFEGAIYESLIDGNVWSPADYPAGWKLIEEE